MVRVFSCLTGEHNLYYVGLAAALCVIGAVITFRIFHRIRQADGEGRLAWVFLGAVATGATIWCTHFVAMIAYEPGAAVTYEPVMTGASLAVAILGCAVAHALGATRWKWGGAAGGVVFGATVSAMHYTGMAAFGTQGAIYWSAPYVAASVLASAAFGVMAFQCARRGEAPLYRHGAALLMVVGIVALHFTGMAAMTVVPFAPLEGAADGQTASQYMAVAVALVGLLVLGTGFSSQVVDAQGRRDADRRLRDLVEGSVDGMVVEQNGVILAANLAFIKLIETPADAVIGRPLSTWLEDQAAVAEGRLSQHGLRTAPGDEPVPVEVSLRRETREGAGAALMIYAIRDLRQRLAQERRLAHLARNDSLTGLPNRASFLEFMNRRVVPGGESRLALLAIDLDRFKEVNDIHGHAAGDRLLVCVAERMRQALRPGEFVARLGGDEFVAVTPIVEREEALDLAERLRDAIMAPVDLDPVEVTCGASVGIAVWPDDATEVSALINDADLAMYRAKASLTADVCFYEGRMDEAVRNRRRIIQSLREALEQEQFSLDYQIQTSIETGEATGYEALLRWRLADGSQMSPAEFIPLAEETGLILPIGEWVLRRACAEAASWSRPLKIAVNLSPIQLAHVDLPRLVHQVLVETGLSPSRLELEITETAMISDMDRTVHVLRQLKALGVSIAMDDFGTGYSSLSTLRAFPFDKIKLDRSFMPEIATGAQSQAIVRAVLALGESLAMPVLAEGVETPEQLAFLRAQGCDEAQGYLLGRPGAVYDETPAEAAPAKATAKAPRRRAA